VELKPFSHSFQLERLGWRRRDLLILRFDFAIQIPEDIEGLLEFWF
jgi:hypothetical protein